MTRLRPAAAMHTESDSGHRQLARMSVSTLLARINL